MRILLISLCMLLVTELVSAQTIKQLKINELADYIAKSEKPLVVNFWATWCRPCVEEIPFFISTVNEKYSNGVELLLVSLDPKAYYPTKLADFTKTHFRLGQSGQAGHQTGAAVAWLNETNADIFCPRIDSTWDGALPVTLMVSNKKQYRKFYNHALTPLQLERELKSLTE